MNWRQVLHYNIMNAKATTGIGNTIDIRDYRNITVRIGTASSANATIKCVWAIAGAGQITEITAPVFSSSQSVTNNWSYIQMIDLNDWTALTGSTGVVATWTDIYKLYAVNVDNLDYINFNITAISAGTITIDIQLTCNT